MTIEEAIKNVLDPLRYQQVSFYDKSKEFAEEVKEYALGVGILVYEARDSYGNTEFYQFEYPGRT